jgi:hypothetical protein
MRNNIFLIGYGGWGLGIVSYKATGIQPIDFGEVRSLVLRFFLGVGRGMTQPVYPGQNSSLTEKSKDLTPKIYHS